MLAKKSYTRFARILLVLSVLVVAILAGLRDAEVGSDTISYTTHYIEYGRRFRTLKSFMKFFGSAYEPGFNLFGYVIGTVFHHSSNWFMFWCAVVIYGFTLKTFYYYRNNCSMSMAWLFFLMLNCTEALNITRNYMALAIAAYAWCAVFDKHFKKFAVFTVIAMTFHVSAAFNFILYLIYKGLQKKNTFGFKIAVTAAAITGCFSYAYLFRILSVFSFIGQKVDGFTDYTSFHLQINPLLIRLPFLILILLHRRKFCNSNLIKTDGNSEEIDVFGDFCFLIIIIELILSQMRAFGTTLYRIITYMAVLKYVSYSKVLDLSSFRINRTFMRFLAYAYIIVVFVYWVGILDSGHIYPYQSAILGIK